MPTATKKIQKPTQKKRVRVSNDVRIDAKNPVPFEYGGQSFSILNRSRYVPFLPPNDDFAQQLLEAKVNSVTNLRCITSKARYCAGSGFRYSDDKDLPDDFKAWTKSVNRNNHSLGKLNRKAFDSHFTFGNTPIEVCRYSVAGKKYFHVYVNNLLEWRLGRMDDQGVIDYGLCSKLFLRRHIASDDLLKTSRKIPLYNPFRSDRKNWFKDENGVERTLFWNKEEFTGWDHYGMPSNVASMIFQLLEYKGARYNVDNFDNNMVVSALLALKGNLSQDEANRIAKEAIKSHTGDGKRGRVIAVASEEGIDSSNFHQFDTHKEGSYIESDERWTQKIILSNDWDAILAGIVSPSTMGKGSGFLTKIIEHKLNTTIKPAQQDFMEDVWVHILKLGNDWMGWGLDVDNVEFSNQIDISGLTDVDITPAVQINEVRKAKGLPEDPKREGEYMKSASLKQNSADNKEGGEDVQTK